MPTILTTDPRWPVFRPCPVARQHPLNRSRVGWWLSLPGWTGGKWWYDLMGLWPGDLSGMTAATGWRGTTRPGGWGHLAFDPATSALATLMPQSAAPLNFADGNSISIAVWFRTPSNTSGNYQGLLGCVNNSVGGQGIVINSAPTSSGGASVYAYCGTSGSANGVPPGGGLGQDNLWHRALAVYDRAAGQLRFHLDGKLVNSIAITNGSMAASTALYAGGRRPTTVTFDGALDDATVWFPRALTAADAWMDFDSGRQGYPGVLNRLAFLPAAPPPVVPMPALYHYRRRRAG